MDGTNHPFEETLERHIMGLGTRVERAALQAHLNDCHECRASTTSLSQWINLMQTALSQPSSRRSNLLVMNSPTHCTRSKDPFAKRPAGA